MKIVDRDRGYQAVMRAASGSRQGRRLRVGVHGDAQTEEIATYHEFGTETLPERSFLRSWFDENRPKIERDLRRVAQMALHGKGNRDDLLAALGRRYRDEIQNRIIRGLTPALKESTIESKARRGDPPQPLVTSSGNLLSSIVAMLDGEVL